MKTKEFEHLIGMNSEIARIELESEGLEMRAVMINGNHCEITNDINPKRVNVIIEHGDVKSINGIY